MAVVITGNNTPTAGGVTYGDGTTYANTAAGTSGQFLQSNGASAPTWVTASSSAMVLLAAVNATSGTYVTFDGYFTSAYDVYLVMGSDFYVDSGTVSGYLQAQVAIASAFQTTGNYNSGLGAFRSSASGVSTNPRTSASEIIFNQVSDYYRGTSLACYIYNPLSTSGPKVISWTTAGLDGGNGLSVGNGAASWVASSSALSGIRLYWNSGTFQAGKFQLYGLKNS